LLSEEVIAGAGIAPSRSGGKIKTDEDLETLRGRQDFKRILAHLEAKVKG
jgi:hypothetical protein